MKPKLLPLIPILMGLAVGFTGCIDRTEAVDPTSSSVQEGGKLAFRLTSQDLALLGSGFDSVRIEAIRPGFPTQVSVGSRTDSVVISDLRTGDWTLKVALYDATQSIHWYGEALVNILPGRTVDAEVHLRKATGSVRVHIVIDGDSTPPSFDTLHVGYGSQKPSWTPLKAWRTAQGVYLVSDLQIPCQWPVLTFETRYPVPSADTNGRLMMDYILPVPDNSRWVVGSQVDSLRACPDIYRQNTHFVPWTAAGTITLVTPTGDIVLPDPINPPVPSLDTVVVKPSYEDLSKLSGLPVGGAWRTPEGVYIHTKYDCNIHPLVIQDQNKNIGRRILTLARPAFNTLIGCDTRAHLVFVPFPPEEDLEVANLFDSVRILLPGKGIADTSLSAYTSTFNGSGIYWNLKLDASGYVSYNFVGKVQTAMLPATSLAQVKQILESSAVRYPAIDNCAVPAGFRAIPSVDTTMVIADPMPSCWSPSDATPSIISAKPSCIPELGWVRMVTFKDGRYSQLRPSACGSIPSWESDLNVVDSVLKSVFATN